MATTKLRKINARQSDLEREKGTLTVRSSNSKVKLYIMENKLEEADEELHFCATFQPGGAHMEGNVN